MSATSNAYGASGEAVEVAHEVRAAWADAGVEGAFCARNVDTGEELGFDVDRAYPLASVVKLPLALVVLDRVARGVLDPTTPVQLDPATTSRGPSGLSLFRHPATVAVEDLVTSMLAVSDNAAADALFDLVGPTEVTAVLLAWGCPGIVLRHRVRTLHDEMSAVSADDPALALELAIRATTGGGGHLLPTLDVATASVGSARALVGLLCRTWTDQVADPAATAALREALGRQLNRGRLAHDLDSDGVRVASRTGTFLNLRHEVGVVTTPTGDRVAVAALTASTVPSVVQPETDRAIGRAARAAVDVLRL